MRSPARYQRADRGPVEDQPHRVRLRTDPDSSLTRCRILRAVRIVFAAGVCLVPITALLLSAIGAFAADLTPAQTQFFENKIRPVLANNCYKCHSQSAEKVKAG